MTDLRQRLDRGVAALPGETVFTADHQHMLCNAGVDQMMRQHGHGEPGGAADLHGMRVGWLNAKCSANTVASMMCGETVE